MEEGWMKEEVENVATGSGTVGPLVTWLRFLRAS